MVSVLGLVACTAHSTPRSPPEEPDITWVVPEQPGVVEDVRWEGQHELLVLPAVGPPVEVPRAWVAPFEGMSAYRGPLTSEPTVAIDATRPWREVCQPVSDWASRGRYEIMPPDVRPRPKPLTEEEAALEVPPPPPPPPWRSRDNPDPCTMVFVVRGPARPLFSDAPEYPARERPVSRLCIGGKPVEDHLAVDWRDDVLVVNDDAYAAEEGLKQVARRIRAMSSKELRLASVDPELPWAAVQARVDALQAQGPTKLWLPPCPPVP